MKILITGSSGFIGNRLVEELSYNNELFLIDKVKQTNKGSFIEINLLYPESIEKAIEKYKLPQIDILIHCASILATYENHKDINLLYNNLRITESIIKLATILNPKKLINFSTIGVYPNLDGIYNEKSEINPSQNFEAIYGLSKFCSEELFACILKDNGIKVINLRLSQTIGEGMRGDRIYSIMLAELRSSNKITVWGNGERMSSFISIEYLISVIKTIIVKNVNEGTYNIGEKTISYLELAKDIIKQHGKLDSEIVLLNKGPKSKMYIDTTKINQILNK